MVVKNQRNKKKLHFSAREMQSTVSEREG